MCSGGRIGCRCGCGSCKFRNGFDILPMGTEGILSAETAVSERPSATRSTCSIFILMTFDSRPSPPPQPPVQDTRERITLFPASTAPRLSPFLFAYSLSLRTSGNDDQHLAAVTQHWYALNTFLSSFPTILLTISIHFPVHPVQRRPVYPLLTNTARSLSPITI